MTTLEAINKIKQMFAEAGEMPMPSAEPLQSFAEYTLKSGAKVMIDKLEVGGKVTLVDEGGNEVPAPAGEHELVDGSVILLDEASTIVEIKVPEVELPEVPEVEISVESKEEEDMMKKKIEEMCGLADLDWEARQDKANEILSSTEWKQQLCNDLIGLSFRDLEQVLSGIASERQKREDSCNEKLKRRRNGSRPHAPLSNVEPTTTSDSLSSPRRSLAEILAQVYSPRTNQGGAFSEGENAILALYKQRGFERLDPLLPQSSLFSNKFKDEIG